MKVSDVDIELIHKLLLCVPQSMEISAIDLTDGYNLRLSASTDILNRIETENSLDELKKIMREYESRERKKLQ